mmetsp:Transcript_39166/g.76994  ORF Transcript_39166/g.76994 Transcript_39166/m.76994 type:complete len:242 (+) Transcript_39166:26-751(+)|eukprot:CAMPEP_0175175672 /NCGR_PEP_ID=MMETSP0087-20121206/33339_1 /TAXON_ID=136419 /ORGANISM="Unknown Unknown, Strain D1" /LENGTH=241 /DNA_ID=CAMNT_0016467321 /DNA_START=176 /DNA_END=901 /DNA_ORIENTATION=+
MMSKVLFATALVGVSFASPQGDLSPAEARLGSSAFRFHERPALIESTSKLLPGATQDHHAPLKYALPKYTPGDACGAIKDCGSCRVNGVCVWLPFHNRCVEDRDSMHVYGTIQCGTWSPDTLPYVGNEHDDYRLFHTRDDPRDFNIASLNGGQDVYGLATDLERHGTDAQGNPSSFNAKGGGGEIIAGVSRREFEGGTLEHDSVGRMLPIGVKGILGMENDHEAQGAAIEPATSPPFQTEV